MTTLRDQLLLSCLLLTLSTLPVVPAGAQTSVQTPVHASPDPMARELVPDGRGIDEVRQFMTQAESEVAAGNWKKAKPLLERVIDVVDPESINALRAKYLLGAAQVRTRDWAGAVVSLQVPYLEGSWRIRSAQYLGVAHYHLNELDKSEAYLKESSQSPEHDIRMGAIYYLAMIETGRGDLAAAKARFEQIVSDKAVREPISSYARGMLALFLRPRSQDFFTPIHRAVEGINSFTFAPDLGLPNANDETLGGSLTVTPLAIDTNAVAAPGSIQAALGRGGVGAAFGGNVWARVYRDTEQDFGLSYKLHSSYLFASLGTDNFKVLDMRTHSFGIPYAWSPRTNAMKTELYRVTPGASFSQGALTGVEGFFPTRIMDSVFLKAEILKNDSALSSERYQATIRYDRYRLTPQLPDELSTGPAIEASLRFTTYLDFNKSRYYYYAPSVEALFSQGDRYRRVAPQLRGGYSFPIHWQDLELVTEGTVGAAVFFSDPSRRFDQLVRLDAIAIKQLSKTLQLAQTLGIANQFSNQSVGSYFRFSASVNLNYQF